jgi:hypothetical protein
VTSLLRDAVRGWARRRLSEASLSLDRDRSPSVDTVDLGFAGMSPGVLDIDNEEPPRLSNAANAAMSKPEKE